jgi:hypothetical protein
LSERLARIEALLDCTESAAKSEISDVGAGGASIEGLQHRAACASGNRGGIALVERGLVGSPGSKIEARFNLTGPSSGPCVDCVD